MDTPTLLGFCAVAFVTIATPGPTVLLALHNGSHHGFRGAVPGIAGAVLSDVLLIAATAAGLGALLLASEMAFRVLQWAGVAYLAWLGLALLRGAGTGTGTGPVAADNGAPGGNARQRFLRSLGVALSNPKGLLFFAALLPQFVDPAAPQLPQYALLAALFAGIDALVMAAYALLGARATRRLGAGAARWGDRLGGGALLLLAAALAGYRRGAA
ncbi:MAG: LysE family translocator [Rubrivivax sp.]|nr:LysE family translocator [Rubrivivax sp.]